MFGHIPLSEIRNHWRVAAAFYLVEVVGVAGAVLAKTTNPELNLTTVIAILGPIGFMLGVVWQLANPQRRQQTDLWHVAFQGVVLLSMSTILWAIFRG